uniref:Protein kinase domain-containing protein n=1 Tax=Chenopodium quinoa TaxID=63459 RepID=A0A803M1S3_CHEQI
MNLWFSAQALQVLYGALNNPSQLTGWKTSGGDPCGESWKGVKCDGSAVVSLYGSTILLMVCFLSGNALFNGFILVHLCNLMSLWHHFCWVDRDISGLGVGGTMGYLLSNLASLKTLDMSNNNIHDPIPFSMPPNLTSLNLAHNNLSGSLPYSIVNMVSLSYLNVSRNSLSQPIADVFANHTALATLDLSYNNFSGDIPASFSALSNLSTLELQNNQLTGSLDILVPLPLDNLNVANNHFTGWVPQELKSLPNFMHRNSGGTSQSPESPDSQASHGKKKSSHVGTVIGVVLGVVFLLLLGILLALLFCKRKRRKKDDGGRMSARGASNGSEKVNTEMQEQRVTSTAAVVDLKPPPTENSVVEKMHGKNGSLRRAKSPITATSYTVASLQLATNSFSQENIIGEGSLGRVYRAEFSNGKVLAVKKIDNSALSLQEEDNFLEAVSNMSRLRHPNIVSLVGYCTEHGQRLLVNEYIGSGSLHDMLHFSDDESKRLTWNARVRVSLGTARALEYLHEVCLPSVVHRNFKSANILLDEEFNPHLSDCGLAALNPNTERQVSTQMVGSFGYSAPEFALSGIYTTKSDVYSFGVVMLELLTGQYPALFSSRPRSEQSLVRWATPQLHDIDALAKMVDPTLNGMYPAKSLSRFADIIALCVQPEPEFRPPMSEVVQALVRLVQRAGVAKRRSSDESGFGFRTPDHEAINMSF